MLEYVSIIKGNLYKMDFVDKYSPKVCKSIINYKLPEYKELARL